MNRDAAIPALKRGEFDHERSRTLRQAAQELYTAQPLVPRFMMKWRPRICPFDAVIDAVPEDSEVLDVGCGAGLMLNLLASSGKIRRGVGFDLSTEAVEVANRAASAKSLNVRFDAIAAEDDWPTSDRPDGLYDAVTMVDLVHHLTPSIQGEIIRRAAEQVAPGGRLVYKDMRGGGLLRPHCNRLHDLVVARDWIHFCDEQTVVDAAVAAGLRAIERRWFNTLWYGHVLLVFERPGSDQA